jgi:hypothetical protein
VELCKLTLTASGSVMATTLGADEPRSEADV